VELGAFNIRVNAIAPGVVDTEMAELMDQAAREELINRSALSGVITPDHVANTVAFLVSEQAEKISGQVIRIDGGTAF
jgi:3-oxoacyl-[acyl-carrier protein] reductase